MKIQAPAAWYLHVNSRVGQNHIYTVHIRYFWLANHQIYGVYIRIYTVLANPEYALPKQYQTNPATKHIQPSMTTTFIVEYPFAHIYSWPEPCIYDVPSW